MRNTIIVKLGNQRSGVADAGKPPTKAPHTVELEYNIRNQASAAPKIAITKFTVTLDDGAVYSVTPLTSSNSQVREDIKNLFMDPGNMSNVSKYRDGKYTDQAEVTKSMDRYSKNGDNEEIYKFFAFYDANQSLVGISNFGASRVKIAEGHDAPLKNLSSGMYTSLAGSSPEGSYNFHRVDMLPAASASTQDIDAIASGMIAYIKTVSSITPEGMTQKVLCASAIEPITSTLMKSPIFCNLQIAGTTPEEMSAIAYSVEDGDNKNGSDYTIFVGDFAIQSDGVIIDLQ